MYYILHIKSVFSVMIPANFFLINIVFLRQSGSESALRLLRILWNESTSRTHYSKNLSLLQIQQQTVLVEHNSSLHQQQAVLIEHNSSLRQQQAVLIEHNSSLRQQQADLIEHNSSLRQQQAVLIETQLKFTSTTGRNLHIKKKYGELHLDYFSHHSL